MKVQVKVTLDIDPQDWAAEFGLQDATNAEVRKDVQEWAYHHLHATIEGMGMVAIPTGKELGLQFTH